MQSFLIYTAIILGIIAFARVIKVYELANALRGIKDEQVTDSDNKFNAKMMLVFLVAFFGFCIYQMLAYGKYVLPESASEHGVDIDNLMNFNLVIITVVFVLVNILLFWFAYKYYFRKDNKATYFAHSTKLELLWTIVPAVVLAVIIIYGLMTWNKIMSPVAENEAVVIELYAKQFDWTARYAGTDNKLGNTNYKLISDMNPLALDTTDTHGFDDKLVKGEFHIPVGKRVLFKFRSRDVIHSAYMPHFRAQMNCVPGMETQFHFVPTITTAEMRSKLHKPEFDYILVCNKICGSTHYNMQMKIVVESEAQYNAWLATQAKFKADPKPAGADSTRTANQPNIVGKPVSFR
jgi:cytochrome c oxidase subunit 2